MDHAVDVDGAQAGEALGFPGFEGGGPADAGVVDQDGERAEFGFGAGDHGLDGGFVGDVGLDGDGPAAGSGDFLGEFLGGIGAAGVVDGHRTAGCDEAADGGAADAAGAAGDECDLILPVAGHDGFLRGWEEVSAGWWWGARPPAGGAACRKLRCSLTRGRALRVNGGSQGDGWQ